MEPTRDNALLTVPAALAAEVQAEADKQHRPALDVLQDAVKRGLGELRRAEQRRLDTPAATAKELTPAEAVAHILEMRKGNNLPDGVTIRDLMTHGRD